MKKFGSVQLLCICYEFASADHGYSGNIYRQYISFPNSIDTVDTTDEIKNFGLQITMNITVRLKKQ